MIAGSYFVILGWGITLICGSVYILMKSHKKYQINNLVVFKPEIKRITISILFMAAAWFLYNGFIKGHSIYLGVLFAFLLFCGLAAATILTDKSVGFVINTIKLKFKQA
jgi:hypothetical protein